MTLFFYLNYKNIIEFYKYNIWTIETISVSSFDVEDIIAENIT